MYTVTTKRLGKYGPKHFAHEADALSRRAVASLEEVERDLIRQYGCAVTASTLPESGGTVGPLPDGTVIKVAPWTESAFRMLCARHHIDGFDTLPLADLIAAFNAKYSKENT